MTQKTPDETHFGFSSIGLGEKQAKVDEVFHSVAARYDLMNDLMSGGLHRVWKDIFARKVSPSRNGAFRALDVAGGTGDIAFRIARGGGAATRVTVLDINADMLQVGRERAGKRRLDEKLDFVQANAESLPFEADAFDAYTIAFGIRNVPRVESALAEAFRVLKRGGRFLCLEFSRVDVPLMDRIYKAYSFGAIPTIGKLVTGDEASYRYLVESIERFPAPERFRGMIADAGFSRASFERLTGGVVAIHSGWKL